MADRFAHLHVHTEFSMLDGAARVSKVMEHVAADNQPAVAITDHGVLYGVVDFTKAAATAGVKPIIGIEAYVAKGSRFDRPRGGRDYYHMTLLAENETGYRNLIQLASKAYLEGFYYKPRMDVELLSEHAEGIIATSGCLGGPVPQMLAPDAVVEEGQAHEARDFEKAVEVAAMYQDIFGRDNYFIEIMNHDFAAQQRVLPDLRDIAKRIDAPLLATNDAHYASADEADAHDVLLCIQTGSTKDEVNRFRFNGGPDYYLKTAAEMRSLFPEDEFPGACDNTLWIAERADVQLEFDKILLPEFPVPAGATELGYLRDLVYAGAKKRYGDPLSDEVRDRIEHELRIIEDMGFPAYFLIVWDLIRYAKDRGIRCGPGRGSAAGAIVAYCLEITDLDPIAYGLIFERFLNPGRKEMPDIDMDFDERYRADVIQYAAEKYGSDHVAQIITFSTIKGKQAVRDSARVLGHPYGLGDRISKLWPQAILGREASIADLIEEPEPGNENARAFYNEASELRRLYEDEDDVRETIDTARGLEGLRRQDSIHAAAVVIAPTPITDIVPIQQKGDGAEIVTQYEMHGVEDLGLLKMDFLGLRNLSIIDRALDLIEEESGTRPDIDHVDLTDEKTFDLLRKGDTIGVFQLESSGLRTLIRALEPDRFEEIIAVNALYRPGALGANMHTMFVERKHGREQVEYPHPDLEEVLGETYGIMVYQEQVMQVSQRVAGFSMAEADGLRKAMGKKIPALMAEQREKFVAGAEDQGYGAALGEELFGLIEYFAGYGFNKSHSACYAYVAYQTAWLKANHPAEYMAALLTSTKRDKDKTSLYLNECRSLGIEVVAPDVNRSDMDFTVDDGVVVFGMSAVRNVGEGVVEKILESRREGPFIDVPDFLDRVDLAVLNRKTMESLIKAGAFDGMGHPRKALFLSLEDVLGATVERRRNEEAGQFSLFDGGEATPTESPLAHIGSDEWDKRIRLAFEKEMLGLYISDHPLFGVEHVLRSSVTCTVPGLDERADREQVVVGGVVGAVTRRWTKNNQLMVFFQLEDLEGEVEVLCFPKAVDEYGPLIEEDAILLVKGRVDTRGDERKVIAAELVEPRLDAGSAVHIDVKASALSREKVAALRSVLENHPGEAQVYLRLLNGADPKVLLFNGYRVEPRSDLYAELRELFGAGSVR
ncbi:MAG: DNA polymerase III subunit alpha [Acidimicrobiia bacterium]|nr:DNA polymerase III subunit alpha [Acidimicrobiia bacterium]